MEQRMGLYTSAYKICSDLIAIMKESKYSQISESEPSYVVLYACMAEIECMWTDFEDALANIKIVYSLSKKISNSTIQVWVRLIYSLILFGRRDDAGITKLLNEVATIIKQNTVSPTVRAIYIDMKGKMLIDQYELEKASNFLRKMGWDSIKKFHIQKVVVIFHLYYYL